MRDRVWRRESGGRGKVREISARIRIERRGIVKTLAARGIEGEGTRASARSTGQPLVTAVRYISAVFRAFLKIVDHRTCDLIRLATNGTGILPDGALPPKASRVLDIGPPKAHARRAIKQPPPRFVASPRRCPLRSCQPSCRNQLSPRRHSAYRHRAPSPSCWTDHNYPASLAARGRHRHDHPPSRRKQRAHAGSEPGRQSISVSACRPDYCPPP